MLKWMSVWSVIALCLGTFAPKMWGQSVSTRTGTYTDNQGLKQTRNGVTVGVTENDTTVSASVDQTHADQTITERTPEETQEQGSNRTSTRTIGAAVGHNLSKTVSITASGSETSLPEGSATALDGGISWWILQENWQISLNYGQTDTNVPVVSLLDYDFELIETPSLIKARTLAASITQLATPTTVLKYNASITRSNNRPDSRSWGLGAKQFIKLTNGTLRLDITRSINRGKIGLDTTYGEVTSWTFSPQYLQNIDKQTLLLAGYRYHREDETSRTFGDVTTLGSDTVTLGLRHGIQKNLSLEISGSKYMTNNNKRADIFEFGLNGTL